MYLLTTDEALKFLDDILGIPASEVPNLSNNTLSSDTKLSFLERLIRAFLEREPFQSIYLMSQDLDKRRRPSWDEIKHDLMLGRGGLCYWLNAFMYALLSALGFDSSLTYSTYNVGIYSPNNHVIVLLHDVVTHGSLHLVDVGLGYFVPRAVSLDFKLESEEFTDSFITYKFLRESDTEMYMMKRVDQETTADSSATNSVVEKKNNKDGEDGEKNIQNNLEVIEKECDQQKDMNQLRISSVCDQKTHTNHSNAKMETQQQEEIANQHTDINGKQIDAIARQFTWHKLYVFNPLVALKSLEPFFGCFDECFTDVTRLSTHSSPRAMCWPGGRFLALVNSNLVQELEPGKLTKTRIVDVIVSRKPQLVLPKDLNGKTNELEASVNDAKVSENTCEKSPNETIARDNPDIFKSESSPKTLENPENSNKKNAIESVTNCNGAEIDGITNNTDNQGQVQLSQLNPLVEAYAHYFPQFPAQMVRNALKNWIATGTIFPVPPHLV